MMTLIIKLSFTVRMSPIMLRSVCWFPSRESVACIDVGRPRQEAPASAPPRPSVGLQRQQRERRDAKPQKDVLALHRKRLAKARATFRRSIRHPHSLHGGLLEPLFKERASLFKERASLFKERASLFKEQAQRISDDMKPRGGIM